MDSRSPRRGRSLLRRLTPGPRADGGRALSARGLRPRRGRGWRVCGYGLSARRKAAQSLPAAAKETRTMNEQRFPKGWDEQRVKRLIAELDARTDEEWIAADEAAAADGGDQAVITVPTALLPEIRRLLASHAIFPRVEFLSSPLFAPPPPPP